MRVPPSGSRSSRPWRIIALGALVALVLTLVGAAAFAILVVEQAKKLVTLADFNKCQDDQAKINFLCERVYQRTARPDEVKLGTEFVTEKPEADKIASADQALQQVSNDSDMRKKFKEKQGKKRPSKAPNDFKKREPLKVWEEYTHALLQANEVSFAN